MSASPPTHPSNCIIRLLAAALLLLLANGCSWSLDQLRLSHEDRKALKVGSEQIRLRMRSLVDPMCGEIEYSADQIIASTDDPKIKKAAIEWKAQAIPALREALYQPQPLTATLDTWILLNQMTLYFDQGDGAKSMGSSAPMAVQTCLKMERDFNQVASALTKSGHAHETRQFARQWAAKHPIKGSISHRESSLSRSLEIDINDKFGASDAIADITLSFDDLNRRLEIYSDQMVRQARWEAELLTADLAETYQLDQAMPLAESTVSSISELSNSLGDISSSAENIVIEIDELLPMIERLTTLAESSPQMVARERAITITAIHGEISRSLETLAHERKVALDFISVERLTALQSLHEIVASERKTLTQDMEQAGTQLVDHAFSQVVQLVIGLLIALIIILLIGLSMIRRMISGLIAEQRKP